MEIEEELTEEDWLLLDRDAENEMNNHNGTSSAQTHEQQPSSPSPHIPETTNAVDSELADCFEDDDNEAQMEHLECLKSKFHHGSFRAKQWEIIRAIMDKRDVCAVMATGYGKSLCYQFPAVYNNRITLVISPLIALMQAQVIDLGKMGIAACLVGTAQKDGQILNKIADGLFSVVYSSPEYMAGNGYKLLSIVKRKLALVAIDEAHCVSQWGHDFRPAFRKLNVIRKKLPHVPILAVTATATENVRHDIITLLGLNEPRVVMTSFDRTNLEVIIRRKRSVRNDLLGLLKDANGSVIVYVLKRVYAERIAKQLRDDGITCEHYHAGMDMDKRTEVLQKFLDDDLKVIVATNAFGMGIDKKDIRCVIHYGACKNLDAYYQEVGRAGRDGKAAKAITFFCTGDFDTHDYFLEKEARKLFLPPHIKNYLRGLAAKMRDFLYSTQCRRKIILEYFGENTVLSPRPNCCDNCTIGLGSWNLTDLYEDVDDDGIYDFAADAKILLPAIKCLEQRGISTEKNLLKKFLVGKFDPQLKLVQHERCHGSGRMHSDQYWISMTEQLLQNEFIAMKPNTVQLTVTAKAENWLQNPWTLPLKAIGQMFEHFVKKTSTPLVVGLGKANRFTVTRAVTDLLRRDYVLSNELLKQFLKEVRDAIADTKIVAFNSIATMADLDKMVKAKPRNFDEFRYAFADTFNEEKLNKYGPTFVNAICKFTNAELEMQNILLNHPMPNVNMSRVVSPQILHLLKDRKTKDEILRRTNLTETQLYGDIETLIQTGQPILKTDLAYISFIDFKVFSQHVPNNITNITLELIDEINAKYFNSTHEQIDSGYVRLALAYYAVRFHLNGLGVSYIDCEGNVVINPEKLIVDERQQSLKTSYSTDRQYEPFRQTTHNSLVELLFGRFIDYYPYDEPEYDYSYDQTYDMHEDYYGHSDSVGSAGSDNIESEAVSDEESVQEIEGHSVHENNGDSEYESGGDSMQGSDEESDAEMDQETDEESEQETDEESEQESDEGSVRESEEGSEQESDEGSVRESDEGSERESDGGSEWERDDGSEWERDDGSERESDEESERESDEESEQESDDDHHEESASDVSVDESAEDSDSDYAIYSPKRRRMTCT